MENVCIQSTSPYIHNPYCVKIYVSKRTNKRTSIIYILCNKMGDSTYDDICPCLIQHKYMTIL